MIQAQALRITQKGVGSQADTVRLYVTAITLGQLRNFVAVDRWSPDNPEGYQRPPIDRRLREVAKYILEEQGILPTSVLLGTRPEDPVPIQYEVQSPPNGAVEWGQLTIPDGAKLWIVDGQHRFYGVERAYEREVLEELEAYPFPVSLMENVDRYMEMVHFNIINTRQRKMPTDIVDRHLVLRRQREGIQMIASGRRGEAEYLRATATRIVDSLNQQPGPWYHNIAIPGVPGRDQGLVRQHALVASLEPVLKGDWVRGRGPTLEEDVVRLLSNFWGALKDVWPEAFESPSDYRLQATVGIYSMHLVLPALIQRCLAEHDLSQAKMAEMVQATGITSDFWHKEDGDPLTLGTGMASIRALAYYLTEQLPASVTTQVKM